MALPETIVGHLLGEETLGDDDWLVIADVPIVCHYDYLLLLRILFIARKKTSYKGFLDLYVKMSRNIFGVSYEILREIIGVCYIICCCMEYLDTRALTRIKVETFTKGLFLSFD